MTMTTKHTLTSTQRNLDKNVSAVSTDTLTVWAEAIEEAVQSVVSGHNVSEHNEYSTPLSRVQSPVSYDEKENRLVGYIQDLTGELWDVEILLQPAVDAKSFELAIAESADVTMIQDADEIRHQLPEMLSRYFQQ